MNKSEKREGKREKGKGRNKKRLIVKRFSVLGSDYSSVFKELIYDCQATRDERRVPSGE